MTEIVWTSLDPINGSINIYPKNIASIIEQSYIKRGIYTINKVELGADFFNATINFPFCGEFYQTTPGVNLGRGRYKEPGFRSVKRCEVKDGIISLNIIQLYGGIWRIANSTDDLTSITFRPSPSDIICPDNLEPATLFRTWTGQDLSSDADTLVVIWQWCKNTDGDVTKYSENQWHPYNNSTNNDIEAAFQSNAENVTINLPQVGERIIMFNSTSCFARQTTFDRKRNRTVRRVIKTVKQLQNIFSEIANPIENSFDLLNSLPDGTVPHQFYCPILQEIMVDPVTTIDGFTYERSAIERWFNTRVSSPLTGLDLSSNYLVENKELAEKIKKMVSEVKSN